MNRILLSHFEIVSAGAVQPNTGAAGVAFSGDSLNSKNSSPGKAIKVVALWQTNQVAGFGQVAFPTGHDVTRGFRAGTPIGVNPALQPLGMNLELTPQETLAVTIAGSNVAGDVEQMSMLIWYESMPGINFKCLTPEELESKTEKITTIEASITSSAGPGYSGEEALNSDTDLLINNRDYAVIGMSCRTAVHAMTLRGPDISNVRIAVPGVLRPELSSQYFQVLSRANKLPLIPVINSGNKASTFIGVATDENAGTFLVTLYLALLKK